MSASTDDAVERVARIEVIVGVEGACLAIDGTRVAGPKPWGGGRVVYGFDVNLHDCALTPAPQVATPDESPPHISDKSSTVASSSVPQEPTCKFRSTARTSPAAL